MSSQQGLPRVHHHHKEPVFTDWTSPPKFYSPDFSRKYYPSLDSHSLDSGSLQLRNRKTGTGSDHHQKEPKVAKDVFSRFADTTSLHAMPFVNRASRWYAKVLWTALFLAATGAWIYHSYYLIKSYASFETTSSVKIVYEPIEFPSVTLCNINPVRYQDLETYASEELVDFVMAIAPRSGYSGDEDSSEEMVTMTPDRMPTSEGTVAPGDMDSEPPAGEGTTAPVRTGPPPSTPLAGKRRRKRHDHDDVSIEFYEYDEYVDMEDFEAGNTLNWNNYLDVVHDYVDLLGDPNVKDYTKTVTVFKELLAAVPDKNRTKMGHQLTTMMISCSYDGMDCNVKNFSRRLDIDYGVCWTFNSVFLSQAAVTSARSGSSFGLDVVLYIEDNTYIQGLQLGRGIRLDVHPFGTMPFVMDNGISVAPGQQAYLGLRVLNQTRLGGRYGACDDDSGSFQSYYNNTFNYTIEGCINTCLDRTIAEKCDCYRRTQRQYYNSTDLRRGFCKTAKETDCSQEYIRQFSSGELNCGCHQACRTVEYETVYSFDTWPDESLWFALTDAICVRDSGDCDYLKNIEPEYRLQFLRSNFIHLKIFYRDLNVQLIQEQPAYGFVQFGSDLGGAIGLWIGASLITVFEFLELAFQLCNFCRRKDKYDERRLQQKGQHPGDSKTSHHREYIVREERSRPNSDYIPRSHERHRHPRPLDGVSLK